MRRRSLLAGLLPASLAPRAWPAAPVSAAASGEADAVSMNPPLGVSHRALRFPADHGSHPDTHVEWWYVTGWLHAGAQVRPDDAPEFGFQVTFFRSRTGLAETSASRFAARQLVFAHVALTDLAAGARGGGLMQDERVAREGFGIAELPAAAGTQVVRLRDWSLTREAASDAADAPARLRIAVQADRFALDLDLSATQPVLPQGEAGYSQKGPDPAEASHYYSEPQLAVRGRVGRAGAAARDVRGRAWLDHEWSDQYLASAAVGWDWVGFDLLDGSALMAFRLRRADGSAVWAGGTWRSAAGERRAFAADEVRFEPRRVWRSPRTQVGYPVEWTLATPAGRWQVVALQDDQELDSRHSTGSIYWEGLSALKLDDGRVVGYGYLELTGYGGKLRL
jgi:predicted secreted hydrolase